MSQTQNTLRQIGFAALLGALFFIGATVALAATDNASTNEGFSQGLQKNSSPVAALRSDPSHALGAADGEFVTLGYGGELIVGFDQNMSGNLLLAVQEITGGAYPLETADVYVSTAPAGPWTYVGEATNEEGLGDGSSEFEVSECYQFVRVIDTTDGSLHNATSDGFDVDSFTAEYDENCPVVEPNDGGEHQTRISIHSSAMVMNEVETAANTGGNLADGSYAGTGGDGGGIENSDGEQDVEGTTTGTGGDGGNSGFGGAIQTGNALAETSITNNINSNIIRVDDCGCLGSTSLSLLRIRTHDFAFLGNRARTSANTGENDALGSYAGTGGDGGEIENGDNDDHHGPEKTNGNGNDHDDDASQEVDDSTTGNGGAGGDSSDGGSVLTGLATSRTSIVNLINSNLIRVR